MVGGVFLSFDCACGKGEESSDFHEPCCQQYDQDKENKESPLEGQKEGADIGVGE